MPFPDDLRHFGADEFTHPDDMDVAFLRWLDRVRERADVPFEITNSFRPGGKSLHGMGMAVDLNSRQWDATQKWRVNSAIVLLADEAPGVVEFEPVWNDDATKDRHWHLGVDPRAGKSHEFVEKDD